jgi:hypothetical protein
MENIMQNIRCDFEECNKVLNPDAIPNALDSIKRCRNRICDTKLFCPLHEEHSTHSKKKIKCFAQRCNEKFPTYEKEKHKCANQLCKSKFYCNRHINHPHLNPQKVTNINENFSGDASLARSTIAEVNEDELNTVITCWEINCFRSGKESVIHQCPTCQMSEDLSHAVYCEQHQAHTSHKFIKLHKVTLNSQLQKSLETILENKQFVTFTQNSINLVVLNSRNVWEPFCKNNDDVVSFYEGNVWADAKTKMNKIQNKFITACVRFIEAENNLINCIVEQLFTFLVKIPKKENEKTTLPIKFNLTDFLYCLYEDFQENVMNEAYYKGSAFQKKKPIDTVEYKYQISKILLRIGELIIDHCFAWRNNANFASLVYDEKSWNTNIYNQNKSYYDGTNFMHYTDLTQNIVDANFVPLNDNYNVMYLIDLLTSSYCMLQIFQLNLTLKLQPPIKNYLKIFNRLLKHATNEVVDHKVYPTFLHKIFSFRLISDNPKKLKPVVFYKHDRSFIIYVQKYINNENDANYESKTTIQSAFKDKVKIKPRPVDTQKNDDKDEYEDESNEDEDEDEDIGDNYDFSPYEEKLDFSALLNKSNINKDKTEVRKLMKDIIPIADKSFKTPAVHDRPNVIETIGNSCWEEDDKIFILGLSKDLDKLDKNITYLKEKISSARNKHNKSDFEKKLTTKLDEIETKKKHTI